MSQKFEYEVSVEIVTKYSFTVMASSEDEAEEQAKELAGGSNNEIADNFTGDIEINATDVVCNDEDYVGYIEECRDYNATPLSKDEDWEKHLDELVQTEWYNDVYVPYIEDKGNLITDNKEKKKYIKKIQDSDNPIVRVFTKGFEEKQDIFLNVENLRGRKYFFHIPYTKHLGSNKWEHQESYTAVALDKLIDSIDIYDEKVIKIDENEAKFLIEKLGLVNIQ